MPNAITVQKAKVQECFNPNLDKNECVQRYNLRKEDFENAMKDIYELMGEMNQKCVEGGWTRFEDMLQLQALSNVLSNLLNSALAKHSRSLVVNSLPNGHPDLIREGRYERNSTPEAEDGVEVKATKNVNVQVDMHSSREQDLCTFVYQVDKQRTNQDVPTAEKKPLEFIGIFLGHVEENDYRENARGEKGTKTATLAKAGGLIEYRKNWIYLTDELRKKKWAKEFLDSGKGVDSGNSQIEIF